MNDQIDAFVRLQALYAQGALTTKEYEQEKARLRGSQKPAATTWEQCWATGRAVAGGAWSSSRWWLLGSAVVISVIGAYFFGKAASLPAIPSQIAGSPEGSGDPSTDETVAHFGEESPWSLETKSDQMTDTTIHQASATFEGKQFDIEVGISCKSTGEISYVATSFDKDHEAAEMRVTAVAPSVWGQVAGSSQYTAPRVTPGRLTIDFQVRADDNEPFSWSNSNPQYNNQISIDSDRVQFYMGKPTGDRAEEMAAASNILLRLFMPTGEETIKWSQTEPAIRNLLAPCLAQRQVERERLGAEYAESERESAAKAERDRQERIRYNVEHGYPADDSMHAM